MTRIYECTRNSDQTEGRGHDVAFAWTDDLDEAIELVKGQGSMGMSDGSVYEIDTDSHTLASSQVVGGVYPGSRHMIYGYRRDRRGRWGYGRADIDDSIPDLDKEDYAEYLRLKARFGE